MAQLFLNVNNYWLRKAKGADLIQTRFDEIRPAVIAVEVDSKESQGERTSIILQMFVPMKDISLGIRRNTFMNLFVRVIGTTAMPNNAFEINDSIFVQVIWHSEYIVKLVCILIFFLNEYLLEKKYKMDEV